MDLVEIITNALNEKMGENILIYDVRGFSSMMDTMILASSRNLRQNYALARNVKDRLDEAGYEGPFKIEGNENSGWLLIDLDDVVVHVFTKEERDNYLLERLYEDCEKRRVDTL